jgi:hypothetical protein
MILVKWLLSHRFVESRVEKRVNDPIEEQASQCKRAWGELRE